MKASGHTSADSTGVPSIPAGAIVLWGQSSSGKSGFFGGLFEMDRDKSLQVRRRAEIWRLASHLNTDRDQHSFIIESWQALKSRTTRKTQPAPADGAYPLRRIVLGRYRSADSSRLVDSMEFVFIDPAGEHPTDRSYSDFEVVRNLYSTAASASAIIWMVPTPDDGQARPDEDSFWILRNLAAFLETAGSQQLDIPLAVCLTKIDKLDEADRAVAIRDPYPWLRGYVGERALRWLEAAFPRVRFFAISSSGAIPNRVEPINLPDLIEWVYGEVRGRRPGTSLLEDLRHGVRHLRLQHAARWGDPRFRRRFVMVLIGFIVLSLSSYAVLNWLEIRPPIAEITIAPESEIVTTPNVSLAAVLLDSAVRAFRENDLEAVLTLLRDTLPYGSPEAISWDSLAGAAAGRIAAGLALEEGARGYYELARARAERAIAALPPTGSSAAELWIVRAEACVHGQLGCTMEDVRRDLALAEISSVPEARRRAAELRSHLRSVNR